MAKDPEYVCTGCGFRFSYEDRDYRTIRSHYVIGDMDYYEYEEVMCCPKCGYPEIEEIEEDE